MADNIPKVPEWFIQGLSNLAGLNQFGEPILKLEWGGTATKWPGGPIKYLDHFEPGQKYYPEDPGRRVGYPRWFLVYWSAPCYECIPDYERQRWAKHPESGQKRDILGPEPKRGKYRPIRCLEDDDLNPLPFTEQLLNTIRQAFREGMADHETKDLDAVGQEWKLKRAVDMDAERAKKVTAAWSKYNQDRIEEICESVIKDKVGKDSTTRRGSTFDKDAPRIIIPNY